MEFKVGDRVNFKALNPNWTDYEGPATIIEIDESPIWPILIRPDHWENDTDEDGWTFPVWEKELELIG